MYPFKKDYRITLPETDNKNTIFNFIKTQNIQNKINNCREKYYKNNSSSPPG